MSPLCYPASQHIEPPGNSLWAVLYAYMDLARALNAGPVFWAHDASIRAAFARLHEVASLPFSDGAVAALLASPEIRVTQKAVRRALRRYETQIDRAFSLRADGSILEQHPFYESQRLLAKAESSLGKALDALALQPFQRLAFVGAGALPLAPLLLHRATGCRVACFGATDEEQALGARFLARCDVDPAAIVYDPDFDAFQETQRFPLVLLESHVAAKKSILTRWRRAGAPGRMALRSATGLNTLFYEPLQAQLGDQLFLYFSHRTTAPAACLKTTYLSAAPTEQLLFEKEEPKPEWSDIHFLPRGGPGACSF